MVAIKEIISEKKLEEELPFDIVDDAHVHMKNDKEFYRKINKFKHFLFYQ